MRYSEHIETEVYYYACAHNKSPEAIFISTPLYCALEYENVILYHADGYISCFGIPIQTFYSENMEYYLAESGFCLDD